MIYGPSKVYEVVLPLEIGEQPFGDVRVGVSTLFLGNQITPELHAALTLSFAIIIFTTLSAGLLSYRLLRPLQTISRSVDLLARGEYSEPVRLKRSDEWGVLSSKLNLLGEQMRGEKAAFVQLKENLDQLFSKLSDGLLLFERQDRLVLATPAAARLLGCTSGRHSFIARRRRCSPPTTLFMTSCGRPSPHGNQRPGEPSTWAANPRRAWR